jgi:hypothetical protein
VRLRRRVAAATAGAAPPWPRKSNKQEMRSIKKRIFFLFFLNMKSFDIVLCKIISIALPTENKENGGGMLERRKGKKNVCN